MLNHKQQQQHEFTDITKVKSGKGLQSSVMDRLRLTIFNLTDIWNSKIEANKLNKSSDTTITANRKALDVLNVWTKHRRSPSTEPRFQTHKEKDLYSENNFKKLSNDKNKYKSHNGLEKFNKQQHKHDCKVSSNQSNQYEIHARRRSFDFGLNQINDFEDSIRLTSSKRRRGSYGNLPRQINIDQINVNKKHTENRKYDKMSESQQTLIKARLKFKKIRTSDDLYADAMKKSKSSTKILNRQSSVLPIITINDFGNDCNSNNDKINRNDNNKYSERANDIEKPRKKLSFREPVVSNDKLKKVKTSPRISRQKTNDNKHENNKETVSTISTDLLETSDIDNSKVLTEMNQIKKKFSFHFCYVLSCFFEVARNRNDNKK